MSKEKEVLIPPDLKRCQAEQREGSFMTLGPRRMVRCDSKPVWIATEKKSSVPDGEQGSMSLCDHCKAVLVNLFPNRATFKKIVGSKPKTKTKRKRK